MTRTIEDLLAASMREEVADLTPAPDLVARAARRHRQRTNVRLAASVTGAAGIAAAAAIGLTVASSGPSAVRTGPGAAEAGGQAASVVNATTLADRVSMALSAASHHAVLYTRTSCACGTTAVTSEWDYGISTREQWFSSGGTLNFDGSAEVSHGLRVRRFVDYTTRTWQMDASPAATFGAPPTSDDPRAIRALIASGPWRPQFGSMITTTVNGRKVVKITRKFVNWSAGYPLPPRRIGGFAESEFPPFMPTATPSATSLIVWFDAATYLPVREALTTADGKNIDASTYTWLPPTPANLAKARTPAPIPARFTQTQLPGH
jgi:hypothetical protein